MVEDVFVGLARRGGELDDDVTNVRLGLLAMARRRITPAPEVPLAPATGQAAGAHRNAAVLARLGRLASEERETLALVALAEATLTEAALVLQADRGAVGSRLRSALRCAHVAAP